MSTGFTRRSPLVELAALGVALLALFAFLIWFVGVQGVTETPESAGSSLSSGPRGTLALYRWLERSGFSVSRAGPNDDFPPDADTLLMINPSSDFPQGQAKSVRQWVQDGHTLVLALGSQSSDISIGLGQRHPMLRELSIDFGYAFSYTQTVPVAQPIFTRPAVSQVSMPGILGLKLPLSNTVTLVSSREADGSPVTLAAMMKVGDGRVFVLAGDYALSNQGIREEDNGSFIYNLVQMAGGRRVAFDEAHHGVSTGGDLIGILTSNPWGWALIYGVLLLALYAVWSARRLGPPLPPWSPEQRRPTSEYVASVARLFRRARKPGYAAERYLRFFKRTLSRHAELDPYLTDENFVRMLAERGRYAFDPAAMSHAIDHLRRLEGEGEGRAAGEDAEMDTVKAIREAERARREALGLRLAEPGDLK